MSPDSEQAALLLRKASEDQDVLEALVANREIADAALGFHAQQAVEKALKAVLASRGHDYPLTHDLQLLLRTLEMVGVEVPPPIKAARRLTPWAVEFRYGDTLDELLDRAETAAVVREVLAWASRMSASAGG